MYNQVDQNNNTNSQQYLDYYHPAPVVNQSGYVPPNLNLARQQSPQYPINMGIRPSQATNTNYLQPNRPRFPNAMKYFIVIVSIFFFFSFLAVTLLIY